MRSYKHQSEIVEATWNKAAWALFCDTGTGKTKIALDTATKLYLDAKIDAVLIIAPAGIYRNWTDIEMPKHLSILYRCDVWKSSNNQKVKQDMFMLSTQSCPALAILAVNIEALSHPKSDAVKLAEAFLRSHRCMMVVDESTQIKVPSSLKTKTVLKLGKLAAYRRILSGMPVTESPENLYTQCAFLDTPEFPYNSFYVFRNRYCTMETKHMRAGGSMRSFQVVTGSQREDELHRLLSRFSSIIHKSQCLDLPDKVYERRIVQMSREQSDAYQKMRKDAAVVIRNEEVTALNVLTVLEKQHQIVCGFIKTEDGKTVLFDKCPRLAALLDQLEETQGKVVIWSNYVACIGLISSTLGHKYGQDAVATFSGDTSADDRPEIIARFQDAKSRLRFLVANPATGKYSWTLTAAHTAIYYSNSYKLEDRHQSEDRLHRIGQENKVTYIDLVTPGTVDEAILDALREKRSIAAEIMGSAWKMGLAA